MVPMGLGMQALGSIPVPMLPFSKDSYVYLYQCLRSMKKRTHLKVMCKRLALC